MAKLVINSWNKKFLIPKELYGQFSEHIGRGIYEGIYVGDGSPVKNKNGMRCDVVDALKKISVPVLRWPGGCFADYYHWKDGIGPNRKRMINANWGSQVEDNSFGTHEFMELCEQIGCSSYVCGNVGSGTVEEMSEWLEYLTCERDSPLSELRAKNGHPSPWKVKYWGIGNENWGCGGNMTPAQYGEAYRRYRTFCRNFNNNNPFFIAGGADVADYEWTEGVMKTAAFSGTRRLMDGISLHYYTQPNTWEHKKYATEFDRCDYYRGFVRAFRMEELIIRHCEIMSRFDPFHEIGLIVDEWGVWHEAERGTPPDFLYQQGTMRDALLAAVQLDIFNRHADRIKMANLAQMVNVIHSLILTEPNHLLLTPTYYTFSLYRNHQDALLLDSWLETAEIGDQESRFPNLSHTASILDNCITLTISNLSPDQTENIDCYFLGFTPAAVEGQILQGDMAGHNTFEQPNTIMAKTYKNFSMENGILHITLPACCLLRLTMRSTTSEASPANDEAAH